MNKRNLAWPLIAFAGGAILGRLFGLKALARGAMTAAALTGVARQPALVDLARDTVGTPASRRRATRPARKRTAQKRSKPM